jgi:membrane fusion protein (multidrug efflux system)
MNSRTAGLGLLAVAVVVTLLLWSRRGTPVEAELPTDVAVHVAPITRATMRRYVTAYGYVEAEPAHDGRAASGAVLSPYTAGVVSEVDAVEGQRVDSGAVLFRLDSRLADVAVQRAQQEVGFAEKAFQRQQQLLPTDGTSQRAFQEAQQRLDDARSTLATARTQLAYLVISAPLAGTVGQLNARVGQAVDASTVLATIVDAGRLAVAADVPVSDATGLMLNQTVLIGTDSAPPRGRLIIIGRDIDPNTGTYRVHATIPPGTHLTPGQFIAIRIVADEHQRVLAVPDVALITHEGEGSWIMVAQGDSASRVAVTPGIHDGGMVEVTGEGLQEGTTIVTDEAYSLPERTKIHIVRP